MVFVDHIDLHPPANESNRKVVACMNDFFISYLIDDEYYITDRYSIISRYKHKERFYGRTIGNVEQCIAILEFLRQPKQNEVGQGDEGGPQEHLPRALRLISDEINGEKRIILLAVKDREFANFAAMSGDGERLVSARFLKDKTGDLNKIWIVFRTPSAIEN
jgi:hypothetical protein